MNFILPCIFLAVLLAGCSPPAATPAAQTQPTETAAAATPTVQPTQVAQLSVELLYPNEESQVQMGQTIKFIAQVKDPQGSPVSGVDVVISVQDPDGERMGEVPTTGGNEGVYRSEAWTIPHKHRAGEWNVQVEASSETSEGSASGSLHVLNSTSEELYYKYGFWLDAPSLRGIVPQIVAERGDAQNGMIRWGGTIVQQHVLPANWVEIQWRTGDYGLDQSEDARRFLLEELGDLGFTPIREIGPFEPTKFKQWDAWIAEARGLVYYDLLEYVVFYAPEVDKTYAIGTTVVQPPSGVEPHSFLRQSFEVDPAIQAEGLAPEPLPDLLPGPELISPELGARFTGLQQPIVLKWEPVKEQLEEDEYYEVFIEYNWKEASPNRRFGTRETEFTMPESLYSEPNCSGFNWRITLKRQTGVDSIGQPIGEPVSHGSLYWFFWWFYPLDAQKPFVGGCPNAQY